MMALIDNVDDHHRFIDAGKSDQISTIARLICSLSALLGLCLQL